MHDRDARWIQWWCAPWQSAHPSWMALFAERSGLPVVDAQQLLRGRHDAFLQSVGITPSQPPEPPASWVQWLMLNADQQREALTLAGSICLGPAANRPVLIADDQSRADRWPEEHALRHEAWCRSVAKALRPGVWLAPSINDPRLLLAAWAGEACWSRLRLSWAPDEIQQNAIEPPVAELPPNKLQTLWQSVLWRVTSA
ncbi:MULTISPECIES: type III secretion protein [unclassified Pseudomonas]|uniref:type III secretion protein n=1 Tax=unclassified Pseudomonas TaxID=196821 RepID=UPI0025D5FB08|nr:MULTISPECIES: type III secretion protein [unclassified Pseudomonas]